MATAAQAEASRVNGAKSSGPVTAEGKARSARNSLRHGFTAAGPVSIPAESREEYDSILAALVSETNPAGEIEENLIEELAIAKWRLNRIRRAQETLLAEADGDFLTALNDPEKDRKLRLLIRYEKDFERQYRATYKLLLDHRARVVAEASAMAKAKAAAFHQAVEAYITGPMPGQPAFPNEPGQPPSTPWSLASWLRRGKAPADRLRGSAPPR